MAPQATDEGGWAALTFAPNIFGTAPLSPTCHPERSGTPGLRASATTEQRRAVEPRPPGGAPAGGISLAKRHHITLRTAKKAFPFEGEEKLQAVCREATDEGEIGERTAKRPAFPCALYCFFRSSSLRQSCSAADSCAILQFFPTPKTVIPNAVQRTVKRCALPGIGSSETVV